MRLKSYFAQAAARELGAREKHYPQQVEAGALGKEDAETDLAAWRAIAELFDRGDTEATLSWAQLEHATSRALIRREEALAGNPHDQRLIARRDAVWGIHERIVHHRAFFMG